MGSERLLWVFLAGCAPNAAFEVDVDRGTLPLTVHFDATASTGTLSWDFGDGATGEGHTPVHTFVGSGTWTVTLTASDGGGRVDETSLDIDVWLEDCPRWREDEVPVVSSGIVEASGLAWADGVLWTHNDSGDGPRVFALDTDGRDLGEATLSGAPARDWETMSAWGPMLVIGDLGDNDRVRDDTRLLLVNRPTAPLDGAELPWFEVPVAFASPVDVEAMAIDPRDDTLILLTKDPAGSIVYAAEPGWWDAPVVEPIAVSTLPLGSGDLPGSPLATGLDIHPDGHRVVVQTYAGPWLFRRDAGPAWSAFDGAPCEVPGRVEQNEAVAIGPAGMFSLPEGATPPLRRYVEAE